MSWDNELKEDIKLTSPENNIFYGLWRKNDRSFEKKLGIFSIPKFDGDIVQDLGVTSTRYPLTIYFDGMYHHKDADEFQESLKNESGQWAVIRRRRGGVRSNPGRYPSPGGCFYYGLYSSTGTV